MTMLSDLLRARDRLVLARSNGFKMVRDANGEEITYKSDGEMKAALAALDVEIARWGGGKPVHTIKFNCSKGL